jgi:hypothetical protein
MRRESYLPICRKRIYLPNVTIRLDLIRIRPHLIDDLSFPDRLPM